LSFQEKPQMRSQMQATCEKKNALRRDQKWNRRSRTGKGRTSKDNLGKSSTKSGSGLQDSLLPKETLESSLHLRVFHTFGFS
jgi:hypothetical protein